MTKEKSTFEYTPVYQNGPPHPFERIPIEANIESEKDW